MTFTHDVLVVSGAMTLRIAQFVVSRAFAYNASHYWTITLRLKAEGETYGRTVGTLSLATRSLAANVPFVLYDDANGFAIAEGERLVLTQVSTGSPAVLRDGHVQLLTQRRAR